MNRVTSAIATTSEVPPAITTPMSEQRRCLGRGAAPTPWDHSEVGGTNIAAGLDMKPRLFALSVSAATLVACAEQGPVPPLECFTHDPDGCPTGVMGFSGTPLADQRFAADAPRVTAIGGTQDVRLTYDRSGVFVDFDLPYAAEVDGGPGVEVAGTSGAVVTVRGVAPGRNDLRIVDPESLTLHGHYALEAATVDQLALTGVDDERWPVEATGLVWAPGDQRIGIALVGQSSDGQLARLVDLGMQIEAADATRTRWDELRFADASPGIHPLVVIAGDQPPRTVDLEVVSAPTELRVIGDASLVLPPGYQAFVCFAAMHGDRYVNGLTWTFVVDGEPRVHGADRLMRNCVGTTAVTPSSTIHIVASAGGLSASADVIVTD